MASLIGSSDAFTGFSSSRPTTQAPTHNVDSWSSDTGAVAPPQVVDTIVNSDNSPYLTENDVEALLAVAAVEAPGHDTRSVVAPGGDGNDRIALSGSIDSALGRHSTV